VVAVPPAATQSSVSSDNNVSGSSDSSSDTALGSQPGSASSDTDGDTACDTDGATACDTDGVPAPGPAPEQTSSPAWEPTYISKHQAKRWIRKGAKVYYLSHRNLSGTISKLEEQLAQHKVSIPEAIEKLPDDV
jgi:hypothetical protein